ncbi:amidase [Leucobacter tardus]|uniref:Amidase n=1 Tax=Leucobacter tardus TaxID=501483 RepID=A0A939QB27_9MICO|nr:amidase [Leucobacter tardus]MBO2988471.1 amidase [Leucobacter tardus]
MSGTHALAALDTDLCALGAVEALGRFRSGELSPVELLEAVLARIDAVDGGRNTGADAVAGGTPPSDTDINAVVQILDGARDAARDAEQRYRTDDVEPFGRGSTALLGLPVATKEKHGIAGEPLSQGLGALRAERAAADHPVVERITAAGGVIHARTSSPEFSCATVTHSGLWGVTRNPWNPALSPGGSSGGAGAALAAGYAPLATASDIAGSTRIPAAFCGVVGYKAPYGRIPGLPPLAADWYRGDGPMARTVADTALLTNVLSGVHPVDHGTVPGAGALPVEFPDAGDWLAGKRIALAVRLGDYPVHPEVERAVRDTAARLAAAGAIVEEVVLPWTSGRIRDVTMGHFGHILGPAMAQLTSGMTDLAAYTQRFIADAASAAERMPLVDTLAGEAALQADLAAAMRGCDVLIAPVNAMDGLRADGAYLDGLDLAGPDGAPVHLDHYWQGHMTVPFNVANRCPVLAVPAGRASNGVPIGMQIVGHPYAEASVFHAGAAVEALQPWQRLAPLEA